MEDFIQDIPFNPAIAGTVHNMCLDNVRRGFGIDNKYASAWEAWEHTQQHADRNMPDGLDVPLFYSYTATIDGITQNWGHINVRLADGTVWSDGTIYADVDAYLYNHFPQYVGWGESVNDFKIIQAGGNDMFPNEGDLINIHNQTGWPGHELNDADKAYWTAGTGNPDWPSGADAVWKALMYEVSKYVMDNPNVVTKEVSVPVTYSAAPTETTVTATNNLAPTPVTSQPLGLWASIKKILLG